MGYWCQSHLLGWSLCGIRTDRRFGRPKLTTNSTNTANIIEGLSPTISCRSKCFETGMASFGNFKRDVNRLVIERAGDGKNGLVKWICQTRRISAEASFKQGASRFKPSAEPSSGSESHRVRQDTSEGPDPEDNAGGSVINIDKVTERAETSVSCA